MNDVKAAIKTAVKALDDHIGNRIEVLNLVNITPVTDYFIIADADSKNQITALCDAAEEALRKDGIHPSRIEGARTEDWVLMDYGDFVIHLFSKKAREFYDLDRIWNDAPRITSEEILAS